MCFFKVNVDKLNEDQTFQLFKSQVHIASQDDILLKSDKQNYSELVSKPKLLQI